LHAFAANEPTEKTKTESSFFGGVCGVHMHRHAGRHAWIRQSLSARARIHVALRASFCARLRGCKGKKPPTGFDACVYVVCADMVKNFPFTEAQISQSKYAPLCIQIRRSYRSVIICIALPWSFNRQLTSIHIFREVLN
jgi:hypothetical protein